ncbi:hypothetical protein SDC9_41311 [bioreactor metagenome]|uniref:Polysaccharide pyruvyl transferase domain-containing protein n=1 Tax=bioreactor metagenome TaxID=1076179 RepID=A0A644VUN3_9ZZZZ
MKRYRIAFCGVFDLANYGDHIFPVIFSHEMEKRGLDYELLLFSPIECQQAFNNSKHVYPLYNLEKMHKDNPFDVFVVAGGEIIHLFKFIQKLNTDEKSYQEYPISQIWLIPAIVANKYGVKLLWNTPGIPFVFEDLLKPTVKSMCSCVDYLSVRNIFSKVCLKECGIDENKINLVPDTVLYLSEVVKFDYLMSIREKVLPFKEQYIVFHCNKFINDKQIESVIEILNNLSEKGYKIVLLPLAYTHDDDIILSKINNISNNKFFKFNSKLSVFEMMSVLAGCFLYIGVSFHGAITALQYGKKAIAFDFMKNNKTRNLFEYLNIQKNYTTTEQNLNEVIKNIIGTNENIDLDKPKLELKRHFDNIYNTITNPNVNCNENNNFAFSIADGITEFNIELSKLQKSLKIENEKNEFKQNQINEQQNYVNALEESISWYKNEIAKQNNLYEYNKTIEDANKSKDNYIKNIEEANEKKEEYIRHLENDHGNKDNYIKHLEENQLSKDNYIKHLEENQLSKDNYIKNLEEANEKKEEYIRHLENDHVNKDNYIQHIEAASKNKEEYIKSLEEDIERKMKILIETENCYIDKIKEQEEKLNNLRKNIFEMEQSLSWKITKILRKGN